jgi:hypothetical protein
MSSRLFRWAHLPALRLAVLAGLNLLVFWLAFVRPADLREIYPQATPHLFFIHEPGSRVHLNLILAFICLALIYLLAWRTAGEASGKAAWGLVVGGSLAFGAVLLFLFPYDAADIFDYIIHGRMSAVYGANPYLSIPKEFPEDPVYRYVAWKLERSPYGPVWGLLAHLAARPAGDGVVANVIAYKLIPGLFLLGSLLLVAAILRRAAPGQALAGTLLLAWNPLVLYETWGNGHNDMVMVFWIVAAAWAIQRRRFTLAILSLTAGILVKFLPVLLVPAALAIALREHPSWRSRAAFLLRTGLAALVLAGLVYAPFWEGPQVITVAGRDRLFSASIPSSAFHLLSPWLGKEAAAQWVSRTALAMTLLFALYQAWRAWKDPARDHFAQASFNIIAFYLLVTILWFQQWYVLWLLGLVPLLRSRAARDLGIFFSFAVLAKQFVVSPFLYFPRPRFVQPWFEIAFTLGVLSLPWLFTLYAIWRERRLSSAHASLNR